MRLALAAFATLLNAQVQIRPIDPLPPDIDLEKESAAAQSIIFENEHVRVWEIVKPPAMKEVIYRIGSRSVFILSHHQAFWAHGGPVALRSSGYRVDIKFAIGIDRSEPKDGVKAAPESHRILFENQYVRVIDVSVKAGATEPMHTHPYPGFFIRDSEFMALRYRTPDGKSKDSPRRPKPAKAQVIWIEPEALHAVENLDTIVTPTLRIELKMKR